MSCVAFANLAEKELKTQEVEAICWSKKDNCAIAIVLIEKDQVRMTSSDFMQPGDCTGWCWYFHFYVVVALFTQPSAALLKGRVIPVASIACGSMECQIFFNTAQQQSPH